MQNRRQKKRCAYSIRLFCLLACGILFTACGERCVDDDATVIGSVEEEESDQKSESGQENLEKSKESEQPKPDAADKDEEPQETGEVIGGKPKEGTDLAQDNEERFYECAEMLKVNRTEAETRYQRLCRDDVFRDQTARLVGVDIEDLDQNGQPDMVVMVQEGENYYYGAGCIYFYMNEDEAYCFRDEDYPFFFGFNVIPGDFDGDGNMEIAFESLGTGCGGAGDWHPRILKYKDHTMAPMDFPYEASDDSYNPAWPGISISVAQEMQEDTYSAYCAYLDDTIMFKADNVWEPEERRECGGNSRGYFNLWRGEYEGKDALEVSEVLYGEGGMAHVLGLAKFLIVWDEDGEGKIVKWWVEPS